MFRVTALCLALGFLVVAGIGCMKCGQGVSQKIAEKAIEGAVEKATGGKANIDVGSNVDLSGLPEFLRYPGAVAKSRWAMSNEGTTGTAYSFEIPDPTAAVVDFYKKALAGWKNASTMENDEATVLVYSTEDEKQSAAVTVGKDKESGKTLLTLLYTKKD
ncbi:hypothetical protein FJY68_05890 [candidate division WOR-3 bacterium]|uniref:Lipoprotein n=1 Tax=candidate division WOR-3 bacterium TaxID=2052148 RepID=A0A937XCW3_UNCW3|nr:hypothetical protein [candidate division WOR-3 bacterium]